jgi:hypothetical protein
MIPKNELKKIARARLKDAEILYDRQRYDGAVYLCGYAVEIALKARICQTLKWSAFPSTKSEFQPYQSFRTHALETLLNLSGIESKIKALYLTEWSDVVDWEPEARYTPIGTAVQVDAFNMIESAKSLLKVL